MWCLLLIKLMWCILSRALMELKLKEYDGCIEHCEEVSLI